MGMLRFKDQKEFDTLLKSSHLKVRSDTSSHGPAPKARAAAVVSLAPAPDDGPAFGSDLEKQFWDQIVADGIPLPLRQQPYLVGSRHTLDFSWPARRIGVEVQGMVHRIKKGFKGDIVKRAQGLLQGWRVLEVGGQQIRDGTAIKWLKRLMEIR
jgi:very-short-patch-repair endonuclease